MKSAGKSAAWRMPLGRLLPPALRAAVLLSLGLLVLTLHFLILLVPALIKLALPHKRTRHLLNQCMFAIVESWTAVTGWLYWLFLPVPDWRIELPEGLERNRSYLIIANHQSWVDILLLFWAFNRRVPVLRFFMKAQLRRVPIIGFATWAMEFPFMKRHSRRALEQNPELRFEDMETTRRFCERFRDQPISVVNFVEGTRLTPEKRREHSSPFHHLLRPKAAGLAATLNAMGDQFAAIIDVTIAYQPSRYSPMASFLRGEQRALVLEARLRPLPTDLLDGDYHGDAGFRRRFQQWINGIWEDKDARLAQLASSRE